MSHVKKMKYVVRKNTQLTSCQEYVYCNEQKTAEAVKARFEKERGAEARYKWVIEAPSAEKEHWCVTGDHRWVVAKACEVRLGQWYIGTWATKTAAEKIWTSILSGDDEVDDYSNDVGPNNREGFVIVNAEEHANPSETWCYRRQLKAGECFEYIDEPGQSFVAVDSCGDERPPVRWLVSTPASAKERGMWESKVKRIHRWDYKDGPVILPCIDPLHSLDSMSCEGLTGRECLQRYEEAMQAGDRVGRDKGRQYVCVPPGKIGVVGGVIGGLSPNQLELAKTAWSVKLEIMQQQQKRADAEVARANALACDDVDELPNMAYVDAAYQANLGD